MSKRYPGGYLTASPVTPTSTAAPGVWTLEQQYQAQGAGNWPAAANYQVNKSLRFRGGSVSAYLNRTPASTGNRTTMTFSLWIKRGLLGVGAPLFSAGIDNVNTDSMVFNSSDQLAFFTNGSTDSYLLTTQLFRDPAAWYHIVFAIDTTQATSSNRYKMYVNGTQVTTFSTANYPSQNYNLPKLNNSSYVQGIGTQGAQYWDGEITEFYFIDGQALTPSSFGTTDAYGIWQPIKYSGSYGTNGYYLPFTNTTSTTTLGYDSSGNGNNWTTNNISLTTGSTYDSMYDSPTNNSSTVSNFCVLNPIDNWDNPPTDGNLTRTGVGHTGSPWSTCRGTVGVSSGKWYFEATLTGSTGSVGNNMVGIMNATYSGLNDAYGGSTTSSYQANGNLQGSNSTGSVSSAVSGDVIMIAFDVDASKMWVGKNGTWMNSGDPVNGLGYVFTALPSTPLVPQVSMYGNSGDNYGWYMNFGQRPFAYTAPTGFNTLSTYNLPAPTVPIGNKAMEATLYTGNATPRTITNAGGLYPDLTWIKSRNDTAWHQVFDSVRGALKGIYPNSTYQETTQTDSFTAFTSTGFTLGSDTAGGSVNSNGISYDAWQWNAGNGSSSSNTDGTITSTVSKNTTAGFSVVTFTAGSGASPSYITVGHGLGVTPSMVILKRRDSTSQWYVYCQPVSIVGYTPKSTWLQLNTTDAAQTATPFWGASGMNSSTLGFSDNVVVNGGTYVAYCWAPVDGFSAFGEYDGNSSHLPFRYTGFKPKFVMIKRIDNTGNWFICDGSANPYNEELKTLYPNLSNAEGTNANFIDALSNGFKIREAGISVSGAQYIYAAFAENPFKMARAR